MNESINFDEASEEWRKNKIYIRNGIFKYKCCKLGCMEPIYFYTTNHKMFLKFASDFDLTHKDNPNRYYFCEDHLLE